MTRTRARASVCTAMVVAVGVLMPTGPARAVHDNPAMVADIQTGAAGSGIDAITVVGDLAFFRANDGANGAELWKTDGTENGTTLVKDINPTGDSEPERLTAVAGTLYFTADDGEHGRELWKSDGTEAGTTMVEDIHPEGDSLPLRLVAAGNVLYFTASDGTHGRDVWKSDGTAQGTEILKDLESGDDPLTPRNLTMAGQTLYFSAREPATGGELWKSDGTEAGTVMVEDIRPGADGTGLEHFASLGDTLFFAAHDGSTGWELWKSDGTAAGTMLVKDLAPGPQGDVFGLLVANGSVFFRGSTGGGVSGLWKSDGTGPGTVEVFNSGIDGLTNAGGRLFFTSWSQATGNELWTSDGTAAGTKMVTELREGSEGSSPFGLTDAGAGRIFFRLDNSDDGGAGELWESDGTEEGTHFYDLNPNGPSEPWGFARFGASILFRATDGEHGVELWKADLPTHPLTVTKTGKGRVTSTPAGVDCGNDCTHDYVLGDKVRLRAKPAPGWVFDRWAGACTGSGKCNVSIDQARSVKAIFERTHWTITTGGNYVGGSRNQVFDVRMEKAPSAPVDIRIAGRGGIDRFDLAFGFKSTKHPVEITIFGGDGGDILKLPKALPNGVTVKAHLGDGNDRSRRSRTPSALVDASKAAAGIPIAMILGGLGHDVLLGTLGNDALTGGAGQDTLKGLEGDDLLAGRDGADTLFGGIGNDDLRGGDGDDTCNGGPGTDTLDSC